MLNVCLKFMIFNQLSSKNYFVLGSEADPKSNAQSEADAQSQHGDKKASAVPALDEDAMIPSRDSRRKM